MHRAPPSRPPPAPLSLGPPGASFHSGVLRMTVRVTSPAPAENQLWGQPEVGLGPCAPRLHAVFSSPQHSGFSKASLCTSGPPGFTHFHLDIPIVPLNLCLLNRGNGHAIGSQTCTRLVVPGRPLTDKVHDGPGSQDSREPDG